MLMVLAPFAGPTLAAFVITAGLQGRDGIRVLLGRYVQWRFGWPWYLVALAGPLLVLMLAVAAVYGTAALPPLGEQGLQIGAAYLITLAVNLFIGGILGEEPGWRGFALACLQQRYGPIGASLVLGTLHGLWHLPALMTVNFGPLPLANYLPFMLTAALATFIYTWVYNNTGGSILLAILLHAASNAATGWLSRLLAEAGLPTPTAGVGGFLASTGWINVIAYGLVALLLIVGTRGRLGYELRESA